MDCVHLKRGKRAPNTKEEQERVGSAELGVQGKRIVRKLTVSDSWVTSSQENEAPAPSKRHRDREERT